MAIPAPTRDLLDWIAKGSRTYEETMEVWRTHCPRLSIWEDAINDGLVHIRARNVELTTRGKAALQAYERQRLYV